MIRLKDLLLEIEDDYDDESYKKYYNAWSKYFIKSGDIVYHGSNKNLQSNNLKDNYPTFFTTDKEDALEFVESHIPYTPHLIEARINFKNPFNQQMLLNLLKKLYPKKTEFDEIEDNLYNPKIIKYIESMGYDSYVDMDMLGTKDIPVAIIWHKNQIEILNTMRIK